MSLGTADIRTAKKVLRSTRIKKSSNNIPLIVSWVGCYNCFTFEGIRIKRYILFIVYHVVIHELLWGNRGGGGTIVHGFLSFWRLFVELWLLKACLLYLIKYCLINNRSHLLFCIDNKMLKCKHVLLYK